MYSGVAFECACLCRLQVRSAVWSWQTILYIPGLISTGVECVPESSGLQCDPIIRKYGREKRGLTSYTLTLEELKKNDYPMRGWFSEVFVGMIFFLILKMNEIFGDVCCMITIRRKRSVS